MNYTLYSRKDDIHAEVAKALLESSLLKHRIESYKDSSEQTNRFYQKQPLLIEHDSNNDTKFTITGMYAIESFLSSKHNLFFINDIKLYARQMQVRENIHGLVQAAEKFVQQLPEAGINDPEAKQMAKEFQMFVEAFAEHHKVLLWQNIASDRYFGHMVTLVEVALAVSIAAVKKLVPGHFQFTLEALSKDNAPEIHATIKNVVHKCNIQPRIMADKGKDNNVVCVPSISKSWPSTPVDNPDQKPKSVCTVPADSVAKAATEDGKIEIIRPKIETPPPQVAKPVDAKLADAKLADAKPANAPRAVPEMANIFGASPTASTSGSTSKEPFKFTFNKKF